MGRLQLRSTLQCLVGEMPQSGERIRGEQNNRAIYDNYPSGLPDIKDDVAQELLRLLPSEPGAAAG